MGERHVSGRHISGPRLSAFLDDELRETDAMQVTRHLDGCSACLHELELLRTTRDALRGLPRLQAPVLTAKAGRRSISRPLRLVLAIVTVPVLTFGAVYALGEDRGGVEPPNDLFLVEHLSRTGGGPVPTPVGGER